MPAPPNSETIAAISTPPGRGGIGIVRLAGPEAFAIAAKLVRLARPLAHAEARFVRVLDPHAGDANAAPLDEAVITGFYAPSSYTGDDLVEIAAHGSPVILNAILNSALRQGAQLAAPGEFTQRAFLSGRIDLTQAEAVHDLIAAQTLEQARAAAQQLGGALSRRVQPAKDGLLHLIALLEAGMDFASGELDDVEVVPPEQITPRICSVEKNLTELVRSFHGGSILRSGLTMALVGRPNAGKSSLFNRLLERPRAIVTPKAGTTRDTVEEGWSLDGIPVRLVDTAGLRFAGDPPVDEAEQQGIERSREAVNDADLVLLVHDASETVSQEERALAASLQGRPHVLVLNKVDLISTLASSTTSSLNTSVSEFAPIPNPAHGQLQAEGSMIAVSALTGQGIEALKAAVLGAVQANGNLGEAGSLNSARQQEAVVTSLNALKAAQRANLTGLPHEVILMDLHTALHHLDSLTGATTADDILGRIFSTFCIGK